MSTPDVAAGYRDVKGVSTEILVAAVVFFLMAIVFVIFIYIYVRLYYRPRSTEHRSGVHRIVLGPEPARPRGLDPAVLEKLPISVHKSSDSEGGTMECAVCLSEVADGERVRVLPRCKHGFHVECIDMWLHSHSTCPLCRDPLVIPARAPPLGATTEGYTPDAPNLPTDVMFWGTEDRVSTARREVLVIDIPRRVMEEMPAASSPPPAAASAASSSSQAPTSRGVASAAFRRLFSMGRRGAGGPSGGEGDVERGDVAGEDTAALAKTPRESSA